MAKRMERKTILINIIRIFCIVVFIIQFYFLTKNYLEFNVDKEVLSYIDDEIELPEIHIIIPYYYAFDLHYLSTKYKYSFDQVCPTFSDENDCNGSVTSAIIFSKWLGHSMLLSDIEKYSYPTETFIKKIFWSKSSENPLETGKCSIIRKFNSGALILIMRCLDSRGSPLKLSRAKAVVFDSNVLFNFPLNATMILFRLIYPGKSALDDSSLNTFVGSDKGKQTTVLIHFTKHTENLLPPPYKTMCKDYDRRQTFEDCLNTRLIKETGMLFPGTTVIADKYSKSSQMRFNSPFHRNVSFLITIYRDCQLVVAQQMCNMVRYSFTTVTSSRDIAQDKQEMRFFLMLSSEPDTITQSKPDFPFSDYLILSGSLVSSWFGISIMGQLLAASHLFCIPYRKSTKTVDFKTKTRSKSISINTIRPNFMNKNHRNTTIIYHY